MNVGRQKSEKWNSSYTYEEDMAIVRYMTTGNRYLKASGVQVWKEAEKLQICPGRPYLSMKERYRKVIMKNLEHYNVDKELASKIKQFMTANRRGMYLMLPVPIIENPLFVLRRVLHREGVLKPFQPPHQRQEICLI